MSVPDLPDYMADDLDGPDLDEGLMDRDSSIPAYRIAGPTIAAFHADRHFVRGLMGPLGGGKTTAALKEHIYVAARMPRCERDGIRRYRGTLFRKTYRQHEAQTIPDWHKTCCPADFGKWRGGANGDPGRHQFWLKLGHDDYALMDMWFLAVGDHNPEDVLQGHLTTTISAHEWTQMGRGLLEHGTARCGRYPDKSIHFPSVPETEDPFWFGMWGDFNAPDEDADLAQLIAAPPAGYRFFCQPGGLDPDAENLHNLVGGRRYYERIIAGKPDWWVRRMIHNRIGYSRDGKPVFASEWDDRIHVALQRLNPLPGVRVHIGLDGGRHPAAFALQRTPMGRCLFLRELAFEGPARPFARALKSWIAEHFSECPLAFYADETTASANSEATDDIWLDIMEDELGTRIEPISNVWSARYHAMSSILLDRLDPLTPVVQCCPKNVPIFRRAINSRYAYKKRQSSAGDDYDPRPMKLNPWADVMDCAIYAVIGSQGRFNRLTRQVGGAPTTLVEQDNDPLG